MTTNIDPDREPEAAAEFDRQMRKKNCALREQNDAFRTDLGLIGGGSALGWLVITRGVLSRGSAFVGRAAKAVREFSEFTLENDPWGEHDFGTFQLNGETLFWKIDYYSTELGNGFPDPRDPAATRRFLTILLAEEY